MQKTKSLKLSLEEDSQTLRLGFKILPFFKGHKVGEYECESHAHYFHSCNERGTMCEMMG